MAERNENQKGLEIKLDYLVDKFLIVEKAIDKYLSVYQKNKQFNYYYEYFNKHLGDLSGYKQSFDESHNYNGIIFFGLEEEINEINDYLDNLINEMDASIIFSGKYFVGVKSFRIEYLNEVNNADTFELPDFKIYTTINFPIDRISIKNELQKKYPNFEF